jgi:hypothetical protein
LIVVGVEPGKVHGAEQLDGADLEGRLEPYLGSDGPDWECHYRPVANQHVLVICVRPPLPSDPIYTLRKSLDRNWAGTVFIRRGSKTVPADDKELAMLQRRLLAGQPSTSIDGLIAVERSHDDGDLEIPRCDVDERDLQPVIDARRQELSLSPNQLPPDWFGRPPSGVQEVIEGISRYNSKLPKYNKALDEHMVEYERWLRGWITMMLAFSADPPLIVHVHNRSAGNLERVQVELRVSAALKVYEDDQAEDVANPQPPEPPKQPGASPYAVISPRFSPGTPLFGEPDADVEVSDGVTILRFRPVHLRPQAHVNLPVLRVIAVGDEQPRSVRAQWKATATSHNGVAGGQLNLTVSDNAVQPDLQRVMQLLGLSGQR